jgi:pimeloyl-ACP methyl ester carboxylesterase
VSPRDERALEEPSASRPSPPDGREALIVPGDVSSRLRGSAITISLVAMAISSPPQWLDRPEGRLAYEVAGDGPLVVCAPGMGDVRSVYRDVVPALAAAGYRVAVTDLRGHGDSDTTFSDYGDVPTALDVLALVEHLGGPAVLVGSSMGASASVWAAAERPDAVTGLVLLGPFLRDAPMPAWKVRLQRDLMRLALLPPWGPAAWAMAYRQFSVGRSPKGSRKDGVRLPAWFDDHVREVRAMLGDGARLRALRRLVGQLTHRPVEERLSEVNVPALAVIGEQDPDFADPAAELSYIDAQLSRPGQFVRAVLVPECGHYPHSQRPDVVVPATLEFLAGLPREGAQWARGAACLGRA